ncbi:transposase [Natrinema sp. 1APR25-10V2]|uniref:RNA-guided endonuclease InsQ/TnpB family protein n=1 Tax=Natrinema sp. 1APR25-10V2 TaxID=2951081 RepID=UPI0028748AD1|nr:transposase [Natrinema sp. 1APR25-10V2]MDS0475689.1 transposase [Natrinema sp. 1APR25-10V2]
MKRTNTFEVHPRSDQDREILFELLDASAPLWNEVTYERRQQFFDGHSVWDTADYRERYKSNLGSATAQQVLRKNKSAWKSFFSLNETYHDGDRDERPSPPGYWGNEDDGRDLRTYIRNDQYTLEWGARSRLEIPIGRDLKDEYGLGDYERLRLEVAGDPNWEGTAGRLELVYDGVSDTLRARQPVTVDESQRDSPLAEESAALDIGANNLVACTTTTDQQYLYEGRDLFERFRETTMDIASYQSKLDDQRRSTARIARLYRKRTARRNHAQDALVRDLVEHLHTDGVSTVYVGALGDVLSTHWSAEVNEKTHHFWAFSRFIDRIACVCEEYEIDVVVTSETWTTQECPECSERDRTHRDGDYYRCDACGFEGHADLAASRVFLARETGDEGGPMARPVRLEWDNHEWRPTTTAPTFRRTNTKEDRTDRSTHDVGNVASVDAGLA